MNPTDDLGPPVGSAEITTDSTGVPTIKLIGEIDLSNVDKVRASIEPTVENTRERIVFDLGALEFLDSSGVALLLFVAANTQSVEVLNPSDIVRRIIEVTGLSDILHMSP